MTDNLCSPKAELALSSPGTTSAPIGGGAAPFVEGRQMRVIVPTWPRSPASRLKLEGYRRAMEAGDRFALYVMAAYLMHANTGRNPEACLRLGERHARRRTTP